MAPVLFMNPVLVAVVVSYNTLVATVDVFFARLIGTKVPMLPFETKTISPPFELFVMVPLDTLMPLPKLVTTVLRNENASPPLT